MIAIQWHSVLRFAQTKRILTVSPASEQEATINATLAEMQTLDTTLDGYIDTLEVKVSTLEASLVNVNAALETLESNKTSLIEAKTALESEINAF